MMKKMMVLYNETSGSSESKEIAERLKKAAEAKGEAVILQRSNPGPFIMPFKILKTPFVTIK